MEVIYKSWIPPALSEQKEFNALDVTINYNLNCAWNELEALMDNQFVESADENTIKHWEKILKILPSATDTLDERRFRILARFSQELPYTVNILKRMLTTLCGGSDGYSLKIDGYELKIKLALSNKNNYYEVVKLLKHMIPANMVQSVTIMCNSHETLSAFTHEELSSYTYDELRNEVISNEQDD